MGTSRMSDVLVEVLVQRPGQPERTFSVRQGVAHAGRAEDNEVVLPDMGVSRKHVRLRVEDRQVVVEDLGSGNGTYHRGARIQQVTIGDGDQIYVDPFTLTFKLTAGKAAIPRRAAVEGAVRPARLVTVTGARLEPSYPIPAAGTTMGRSNQREIVLYDPAASRLQAEILWREDGWWLKDEASANGTFVNGDRTTLHRLRSGDRVRVGATELRFEEEGAVPDSPPVRSVAPVVPVLPPAPAPLVSSGQTEIRPAKRPPPPGPSPAPHPVAMPPSGPTLVLSPVSSPPPVPAPVPAPAPAPALAPQARPPSRRGFRGLVIAAVLGFAFLCVLVSGGLVLLALRPDLLAGMGLHGSEPPIVQAPAPSADVRAAMEAGQKLFDERRYLDAMARFYEVRKKDPQNVEAERMVYLSGELILIQSLRESLVARTAPTKPTRR